MQLPPKKTYVTSSTQLTNTTGEEGFCATHYQTKIVFIGPFGITR